jgi:5'(3')-deoxyribonucleotidase
MTKPIIAIDVDEVLADYASEFVVVSNRLWGTDLKREDYHENWPQLWGLEMGDVVARSQVMLEDRMHERLKHDDQAIPVLKALSERFTLKILTARNVSTKEMTLEWLQRHYPMFAPEDVNFAGIWDNPTDDAPHMTKGDIAKQLGVNYIIDDQVKHCVAAAERGIQAVLFGEYPWNQAEALPVGVTRVKNWAAVEDYFSKVA